VRILPLTVIAGLRDTSPIISSELFGPISNA